MIAAPAAHTGKATIAERYHGAAAAREPVIERARLCAALTKPWLLPREGQSQDTRLDQNFQSLGARGITNLEGKMLLALWPPGQRWVRFMPPANIRSNPDVPFEVKQELEARLFLQETILQAALESSNLTPDRYSPIGFRTTQRMALSQILVTGETLERMGDDFRITVFRRDQYVTQRDSSGEAIWHICMERVDPLSLTQTQRDKAHLKTEELEKKAPEDRMVDLYTLVEYQPLKKNWKVCQEVNGHEVVETEEPVSPYFCTPFEVVPGENYGRGFVEQNMGDFSSYDSLCEKLLDFAAMASKHHPVLGPGSELTDEDLMRPSGSVLHDAVENGVPRNVGWLKVDKIFDFTVVERVHASLRIELGKSMLMETESVRDSERTTAFEIQQTTIRQLEGALGGFYAPVSDRKQVPMVQRGVYVLKRDRKMPSMPGVEVQILTGLAALTGLAKAETLLTYARILKEFGEEALAVLNQDVVADVVARYLNIDEPGVIKTPAERRAEVRAAQDALIRQAAAEQAIQSAGAIAESRLGAPAGAAVA